MQREPFLPVMHRFGEGGEVVTALGLRHACRAVASERRLAAEIAVERDGNVLVAADAVLDGFRVLFAVDERLPRINVFGFVEIAVGDEWQASE